MHILLLNQYFPPDSAATAKMAAHIADALTARHRVTVLAGRPSYHPSDYHPYYLGRQERRGNLVIERVGSTAFHRRRMVLRITNYLTYLFLAIPRALRINSDLVLSMTDPPIAGIAAALVAQLRRLPFVYNIRDLYPDMAVAGGIVRAARWVRVWEELHNWALRQAARVVVLGDDMRQRVLAKGIDPERVVVVRDGTPVAPLTSPANPRVRQEIRCGFSFVVLHAGNLGFYGAWETLLEAARILEGEDIAFVFVGDGAAKSRLAALADGCQSLRFLPFRPPEDVDSVMAAADLHVVTLRRGLEGIVVPSKLYSILAAGRPILAVVPESTDVAQIVRANGCGVVADPDNCADVATAVRSLARDRALLNEMSKRSRAVASKYGSQQQIQRFVQVIEEAAEV